MRESAEQEAKGLLLPKPGTTVDYQLIMVNKRYVTTDAELKKLVDRVTWNYLGTIDLCKN